MNNRFINCKTIMCTLYDDLLKQINIDGSIDIDRVCSTINNIFKHLPKADAEYHYKMIEVLILHHKTITDGYELFDIPYNAQIMIGNRGILNNMEQLPPLLQHIIAQYVENYSIK